MFRGDEDVPPPRQLGSLLRSGWEVVIRLDARGQCTENGQPEEEPTEGDPFPDSVDISLLICTPGKPANERAPTNHEEIGPFDSISERVARKDDSEHHPSPQIAGYMCLG